MAAVAIKVRVLVETAVGIRVRVLIGSHWHKGKSATYGSCCHKSNSSHYGRCWHKGKSASYGNCWHKGKSAGYGSCWHKGKSASYGNCWHKGKSAGYGSCWHKGKSASFKVMDSLVTSLSHAVLLLGGILGFTISKLELGTLIPASTTPPPHPQRTPSSTHSNTDTQSKSNLPQWYLLLIVNGIIVSFRCCQVFPAIFPLTGIWNQWNMLMIFYFFYDSGTSKAPQAT